MAKYPGRTIKLGDKEYVLPALSLGQLRSGAMEKVKQHDALVEATDQNNGFESAFIRGELVLTALRRNYNEQELPDSEYWNAIDLANLTEAWRVIIGLSGFTPGEALAGAEVDNTMSSQSTPPLPPPMDGPIQ